MVYGLVYAKRGDRVATKRKLHALSAAMVRTEKEPGIYADGHGLNLKVEVTGAKRWVQRVTIKERRRNLGLGGYPEVSLAEARDAAAANQRAIREGRDPIAEKRQAAEEAQRPPIPTFCQAATTVIALRRPTWTNAKHAAQWESTLAAYVYPVFGNKLVDEITSADVLTVLSPIWTSKPETASRVRQRVETIVDWAIAQGYRTDNPAGKPITKVLPKPRRQKTHHAALPCHLLVGALNKVRGSTAEAYTKLALEFLVLTACRSGEVRLARWSEVDWDSKTWTVPASRMKARRDHRVPLSARALEVLSEARERGSNELLFPGRSGQPISDMSHTALLRRLEIPCVPHGFRSSFKDWCIECTDTPWAVGEAALAHVLGNSTEAAYARTDLFERRRALMEAWTAYLENGGEGAHQRALHR